MDKSLTRFEVGSLLYLRQAIQKLKSYGGITILLPSLDWEEEEIAIKVHCDDGNIMTNEGSIAPIEICVCLRKEIPGDAKNQDYNDGTPVD